MSDHTKRFITYAQTRSIYEYIQNPFDKINASIDSAELNEYKGNKILFNSGMLHRFQNQKGNNTINQLIRQGKKAYGFAANRNHTSHSTTLYELSEQFEYIREKIEYVADKFIFSQKNEYSMNSFLYALGNNPLIIPTDEQKLILMRNWNNINL